MESRNRKRAIARRYIRTGAILAIFVVPLLFILVMSFSEQRFKPLAHFGPFEVSANHDTIWHSIPPFQFTNQFGEPFGADSLRGRIHIACFFFTTCPGICPTLSREMERLQDELGNELPEVLLLSYSIDPETDTIPALYSYAQRYNAKRGRWYFLRGAPDSTYALAGAKGYLLAVGRAENGPENGFFHDDRFVLVDWNLNIRGYYYALTANGHTAQLDNLKDELRVLIKEYRQWQAANGNLSPAN
jgi:protein SCO1/2